MSWLSKLKPINLLASIFGAFLGLKAGGASDATAIQQAAVTEIIKQLSPAQVASAKDDIAALQFTLTVAAAFSSDKKIAQAETFVADLANAIGP
jgi:hypothetical protein